MEVLHLYRRIPCCFVDVVALETTTCNPLFLTSLSHYNKHIEANNRCKQFFAPIPVELKLGSAKISNVYMYACKNIRVHVNFRYYVNFYIKHRFLKKFVRFDSIKHGSYSINSSCKSCFKFLKANNLFHKCLILMKLE